MKTREEKAREFFDQLGLTAQELKELHKIACCGSSEKEADFIIRKAVSVKDNGRSAVWNAIKRSVELYAETVVEKGRIRDEATEKFEKDFSKKFYCAFVRNTKYSIPVKLRGEEYVVIVPKTVKEMMEEGFRMNNCLTDRAYWMALGTMKFFFIRKKDNIEAPLIDVILSKDNRILWVITKNHENVRGDNKTVFNRWYKTCFGHAPTKADYVPRQEWFKI